MKYFDEDRVMRSLISIAFSLAILLGCGRLPAQKLRSSPVQERNTPATAPIFREIQAGLRSGDVGSFSRYLAKQVYLNLSDVESGFFSDNQASYILKDYFKARRIVSFKFSTISEVEGTPFATGGGTYLRRGNSEILQVYVAMKKSGDRWVIAQFSVF